MNSARRILRRSRCDDETNVKEARSMKPKPQNPAPDDSETADSHLETEGGEDSNLREPQEQTTNTNRDRDGWRAYFPAAVRKTLRSCNHESRTRETFQKLQARFAKTLLFVFFCFCRDFIRSYLNRFTQVRFQIASPSFS